MKNVLGFLLLTVISVVFFTGQPIQSQVEPEKFHFYVEVSCPNETTKNEIESYVKRELRKLGDVEINRGSFYTHSLYIKAIYTGFFTGDISISFILIEMVEIEQILSDYVGFLSEKEFKRIEELLHPNGLRPLPVPMYKGSELVAHNLKTQELSDVCKNIIVTFDVNYLEPIREKR